MSSRAASKSIQVVRPVKTEIAKLISVCLGVASIGYSANAYSQAGPDAGALQQQLHREADRERPQAAPEPLIR